MNFDSTYTRINSNEPFMNFTKSVIIKLNPMSIQNYDFVVGHLALVMTLLQSTRANTILLCEMNIKAAYS